MSIYCKLCGDEFEAGENCIDKDCPMTTDNGKPKLSVVEKLHDGRPSLNDIPNRLRLLADQIEKNEIEDVESCIVILPTLWDVPGFYVYGKIDGSYNPLIHLHLAINYWAKKLIGEV